MWGKLHLCGVRSYSENRFGRFDSMAVSWPGAGVVRREVIQGGQQDNSGTELEHYELELFGKKWPLI